MRAVSLIPSMPGNSRPPAKGASEFPPGTERIWGGPCRRFPAGLAAALPPDFSLARVRLGPRSSWTSSPPHASRRHGLRTAPASDSVARSLIRAGHPHDNFERWSPREWNSPCAWVGPGWLPALSIPARVSPARPTGAPAGAVPSAGRTRPPVKAPSIVALLGLHAAPAHGSAS